MVQTIPKGLLKISRVLRKNQTPWEHKLWQHLRGRRLQGLRFKRQVRFGSYIVDFCCPEKKLIIELDGGQHNETEVDIRDREREKYLQNVEGCRILRFWNNDIDNNFEGVLEVIRRAVLEPHP